MSHHAAAGGEWSHSRCTRRSAAGSVSSCTGARCTRRRVESRTARAETLRCSRMHARADADRPHRPGHFPAPTSAQKNINRADQQDSKSLFRSTSETNVSPSPQARRGAFVWRRVFTGTRSTVDRVGVTGAKAMSLLGPTASLFKGRGGAPPAPVRAHALNMSPRTILDAV